MFWSLSARYEEVDFDGYTIACIVVLLLVPCAVSIVFADNCTCKALYLDCVHTSSIKSLSAIKQSKNPFQKATMQL